MAKGFTKYLGPLLTGHATWTASIPKSGDLGIDGLILRPPARLGALPSGEKWVGAIGYSDPDQESKYHSSHSDLHSDFRQISPNQLAAARAVLEGSGRPSATGFSVEGFTNLEIEYKKAAGNATILLANNDGMEEGDVAYAYLPDEEVDAGDVFFGPTAQSPTAGNLAYHVVIHELGHALGLTHGHPPQSEPWDQWALPLEFRSWEYSVMTYTPFVGARRTPLTWDRITRRHL